jgi:hypothetical protein
VVAEQVILNGDMDDLFRLSALMPAVTIAKANSKIKASSHISLIKS